MRADLQEAVKGILQGGTPRVTAEAKFLGINEASGDITGEAPLQQLEKRGKLAGIEVCRRARALTLTNCSTKAVAFTALLRSHCMYGADDSSLKMWE